MLGIILYAADTYGALGSYGGGYYGFDWTYILVLIGAAFSIWASSNVKGTFKKYARIQASCGMTGAEIATQLLHNAGVYDVKVEHIRGELTDHYDPSAKVLRLSDTVYGSTSVAAISVAAHECGHAMQKNEEYMPMILRSRFVPIANLGSKAGIPIIIAGVFLSYFQPLISLGIVLFSFGMLFQIITLPVEFDASNRALTALKEYGFLSGSENDSAYKVLRAAALTYVAAAAASILSVLRLILIFGGGRGKRD